MLVSLLMKPTNVCEIIPDMPTVVAMFVLGRMTVVVLGVVAICGGLFYWFVKRGD